MFRLKYHFKQQPGVVLILAMLLMSSIVGSTIAIATAIVTTYRQSKNLDNFILASLAADSGLERGLAIVAAGRIGQSLTDSVYTINSAEADDILIAGSTTVSQWDAAGSESSGPVRIPVLPAGELVTLDLFGPTFFPATQLNFGATCGGTGNLEVSWVVIDAQGNSSITGREYITVSAKLIPTKSGETINLKNATYETGNVLQSVSGTPLGFRVRIKALDGPVTNITINALNELNGPSTFQSRVGITSIGTAGQSQSRKEAAILWQPPASPFFNYVLFTEEKIEPEPGVN